MNPFFDWLIKSSVSIALLYLVFKLAVSRDKIFIVNRFILMGVLVISAVLPLTDIPVFQETTVIPKMEIIREFVATPAITHSSFTPENASVIREPQSMSVNPWLIFYLIVILILSLRMLISVFRLFQIIRRAEKLSFQKIILAIVKDFIQPFSFLQHIIISEKDYTENKDIVIAHEYAHIKHLHAIDLLICELFTAIHWFNPFMWLLRRDLKLIHEYQADQAVLNKGIDAKKYQLLVLEKAVGERRFAMANHFTQKPILKRIKMMHKKSENYWKGLKLIFFIPMVLFLLQAFARPEIITEKIGESLHRTIVKSSGIVQEQNKPTGFVIEIKKDGNYIDNKSCTMDEIAVKGKAWQKTGREDLLLVIDESIPLKRIDEVREALRNANVYHVNQKMGNSGEIIYPAGDVSRLASFSQGKFGVWMNKQLTPLIQDMPKNRDREYTIFYGFIIDKEGKVSGGHVIEGCEYPELNEAYNKVLANIPDWIPAKKLKNTVGVYYTAAVRSRIYKTVVDK